MDKKELMKGEKIIKKIRPHPFAFLDLYIIFSYLILMGLVFVNNYDFISSLIPILDTLLPWLTFNLFWWLSLIIPSIVISLFKINWRWCALFMLLGIILNILQVVVPLDSEFKTMNLLLIFFSVVGMVISEVYRRSHHYVLTNKRLILENVFSRSPFL